MKSKTYLFVEIVKRTFVYYVCHSYVTDLKVIMKAQERVKWIFLEVNIINFPSSKAKCNALKFRVGMKFYK